MNGILIVDKPTHLATQDLVKHVRTHFGLTKIDHGGSIDPNASGVVTLLLGNATKLVSELRARNQIFEVTALLGTTTNTYDCDGEVTETRPVDCDAARFQNALDSFRGDVYQMPAPFLTTKRTLDPTYAILPANPESQHERITHFFRLTLTEFAAPRATFTCACSRNALIKPLVHDLGMALGCGAAVLAHRRTLQKGFPIAEAIPFMDLMRLTPPDLPERLIPIPTALAKLHD